MLHARLDVAMDDLEATRIDEAQESVIFLGSRVFLELPEFGHPAITGKRRLGVGYCEEPIIEPEFGREAVLGADPVDDPRSFGFRA